MRIGYLHVGALTEQESGVTRFGRLLAAAVGQLPGVEVQEAEVVFGEDESENCEKLSNVGASFEGCDLVHLQFSQHMWKVGWEQLNRLKSFDAGCQVPWIVTLHDIDEGSYLPDHPLKFLLRENRRQRSFSNFRTLAIRSTQRSWQKFWSNRQTMTWILDHASKVIVSNKTELRRLQHYKNSAAIKVIPHYVEQRSPLLSSHQAKDQLNLSHYKTLVLQGFIYQGKGHDLLLKAMIHLPDHVKVIFAGGMAPGQEAYLEKLHKLAKDLKLEGRIIITGYLSDTELEKYLIAADLAVCPFQIMSASGSLSSWISLHKSILSSKLPQIDELNSFSPDAIQTFSPTNPESLALAIFKWLISAEAQSHSTAVRSLADRLSITKIAQDHIILYQSALGKSTAESRLLQSLSI
jgi:glycosyltransferase involved in cell wall biosynthesis